jgi:O-antigen/teichoic acid export membrane protein
VALISGTVVTQGIIFLASPLLSRIFSLVDFGNLANYNAWVAMLALVGTLRYEHAIIVANGRDATARVTSLTAVAALASIVLFLTAAVLIDRYYAGSGYLAQIRPITLFIPLGVISVCLSSPLVQLCVKNGRFRVVAIASSTQVLVAVAAQIGLGLAAVKHGLIIGTICGYFWAAIVLTYALRHDGVFGEAWRSLSVVNLRRTAAEFANFPRFTLPADAVGVVTQQFIPVFVLALFNPAVAGLYSFSMRIVRVPLLVLSTAVSTALRKEGADTVHAGRSLQPLYRATVRTLFVLGVVPFAVMLLVGPQIFATVFGTHWIEAGEIVRVLSPGIFLEFIAFPLLVIFLVTDTQRITFGIQAIGFLGLVGAMVIGRQVGMTFVSTCYLVAGVMVVVNLLCIVAASRVSAASGRPAGSGDHE